MNKTAFAISIALTAFVLMAVGGIAYTVRAADRGAQAAGLPAVDPALAATIDPAVEQALLERETAYQQTIAEANARLHQAQEQQLALEAQLTAAQASNPATTSQESVTPEEAAAIASTYWGLTSIYSVETITSKGENLYQVTFSSGDLVFVRMNGKVAGAITAKQLASLNIRPGGNSTSDGSGVTASGEGSGVTSGEHENEHEGGDD